MIAVKSCESCTRNSVPQGVQEIISSHLAASTSLESSLCKVEGNPTEKKGQQMDERSFIQWTCATGQLTTHDREFRGVFKIVIKTKLIALVVSFRHTDLHLGNANNMTKFNLASIADAIYMKYRNASVTGYSRTRTSIIISSINCFSIAVISEQRTLILRPNLRPSPKGSHFLPAESSIKKE